MVVSCERAEKLCSEVDRKGGIQKMNIYDGVETEEYDRNYGK